MTKLLFPLALALFVLPLASADPLVPDSVPDSIGHVLDSDLVSIRYTLNPSIDAGDVVPLCIDAPEVPEDQDVLGAIEDDCFQPLQSMTGSNTVLPCDPVLVSILPDSGLPVYVTPNERCIEGLRDWIIRIVSGGTPIRIALNPQK